MGEVQTTAGPVDVDELGLTLIHEHLRTRSESVVAQFPHIYDEDFEYARATDWVGQAVDRGVKTICDPTVMEAGRDIRFMSRVVDDTGVQLVAATGIYAYHYVAPHFQNRDEDYMADQFVRGTRLRRPHDALARRLLHDRLVPRRARRPDGTELAHVVRARRDRAGPEGGRRDGRAGGPDDGRGAAALARCRRLSRDFAWEQVFLKHRRPLS
jgi:hypothetical protein